MRAIALLLVVGSLAACAGELAPDPSGQTTSKQQADAIDPPAVEPPAAKGTAEPADAPPEEYPAPTWGSNGCFLKDGPDAPGECMVGDQRECPPEIPRTGGASWMGGSSSTCNQKCVNVKGTARWSMPTMSSQCAYYDTNLYDPSGKGTNCGCMTPLVLSFDNAHVAFSTEATGSFDLSRNGMSHGSDWPTAVTPWLALDRDGNGSIDDGGELFGSATRLAAGGFARNGFDALRDLDDNHDGVFDAADAAFSKIVVWSDRNADKRSTPNELASLTDAGVRSIDLHDRRDVHCDARNNCEGERSRFTSTEGRRGTVIDVYLPVR